MKVVLGGVGGALSCDLPSWLLSIMKPGKRWPGLRRVGCCPGRAGGSGSLTSLLVSAAFHGHSSQGWSESVASSYRRPLRILLYFWPTLLQHVRFWDSLTRGLNPHPCTGSMESEPLEGLPLVLRGLQFTGHRDYGERPERPVMCPLGRQLGGHCCGRSRDDGCSPTPGSDKTLVPILQTEAKGQGLRQACGCPAAGCPGEPWGRRLEVRLQPSLASLPLLPSGCPQAGRAPCGRDLVPWVGKQGEGRPGG